MSSTPPSQDRGLPRMPTWFFVVFAAWVLFITYEAQFRHQWWGWLGVVLTTEAALVIRNVGAVLQALNE